MSGAVGAKGALPGGEGIYFTAQGKCEAQLPPQRNRVFFAVWPSRGNSTLPDPCWRRVVPVSPQTLADWVEKNWREPQFRQWLGRMGVQPHLLQQAGPQLQALQEALGKGRIQVYEIPKTTQLIETPSANVPPTGGGGGGGSEKNASGALYSNKNVSDSAPAPQPASQQPSNGDAPAEQRPAATQTNNEAAQNEAGNQAAKSDNDVCEGDPVSMSTGEEILTLEDFEIPGPLPLSWRRQYRSGRAHHRTELGYGWAHPFSPYLEQVDDRLWFVDAEQRRIPFAIPQGPRASWHLSEQLRLTRVDAARYAITHSDGLRYEFTQIPGKHRWRMTKMVADHGAWWAMAYDAAGEPTRLHSSSGRKLRIVMRDGLLQGVWQGDYPWIEYRYDGEGNLIQAQDAAGGRERYGYRNHLLAERQQKSGYRFFFEWDQWHPHGRCIRQWGEDGTYDYRFQYNDDKNLTISRDGRGVIQIFYRDDFGRIVKHVDGEGGVHRKRYNDLGQLTETIDPNGAVTRYEYDQYGALSRVTDPLGHSTQWHRRGFRLRKIVDALGQSWHLHRSLNNQIQAVEDPFGQVQYFEYDRHQRPTRINSYQHQPRDLAWNRQGLLQSETQAGQTTHYRYDERTNLIAVELPNGDRIRYDYDLANRLIAVYHIPQGDLTPLVTHCFQYDKAGRLTAYTDADGKITRYQYGGLSQVEKRIHPDGTTLEYRYDEERNLIALINENGERYRLDYDNCERLIREVGFDGREQRYQYDRAGHLIRHWDGPIETTFERDDAGRLLRKRAVKNDGGQQQIEDSRFQYDALGRMTAADNSARSLRWDYESETTGKLNHFGRPIHKVTRTEWQDDLPLKHSLDGHGRLDATTLFDGRTLHYQYGAFDQLTQLRLDEQTIVARTELDALGRQTERALGNGLVARQQFDPRGRLSQQQVSKPFHADDSAPQTTLQRRYHYTDSGLIHSIEDSHRGTTRYHYDARERLTSVEGILDETFAFDPANNLIGKTEKESGDQHYCSGNRLKQFGDQRYEYDTNGNRTQHQDEQGNHYHYEYNAHNQLTRVTKNGDTLAKYQYDALGRRTSKTTAQGTTRFYWQGDTLLSEQAPRSDQHRYYLFEPNSFQPLAQVQGEEVYYYHLDHLGTPQALTDHQGDSVWRVTYSAYGNVVQQELQAIDNPLRFQGQYFDAETGLHYNRHRYYDPRIGQFIHQDPIGLLGGVNNYQYVPNPVGWVDPLGLSCKENSWNSFQKNTKGHFPNSSAASASYQQMKKVRAMSKGARPDPSTYLPQPYIDAHLRKFSGGASRLVVKRDFDKYGIGKPDDLKSEFVSTKADIDDIICAADGDVNGIASALGIPSSQMANGSIVRLDFPDPAALGLSMPTGNEFGTNPQWIPGGKLPEGEDEAIISTKGMTKDQFIAKDLKTGEKTQLTIKEISEKRWVYTLYEVDGKYVITVPFMSSVVDFSRAFEVELGSLEEGFLTSLAQDIVDNYEKYKSREVDLPE